MTGLLEQVFDGLLRLADTTLFTHNLFAQQPLADIYRKKMDSSLRRAKRDYALPYEWTPAFRQWLRNVYHNRCAYCGRRNCQFHVDHIIPASWHNSPGATVDNAVWSCASCNKDRGNEPLGTWLRETFGPYHAKKVLDKVFRAREEAQRRFGKEERLLMRQMGRKITRRNLRSRKKSS
jgi:hypothetical protein